ncbi:hypothetical protein IJJ12_02705 [bacterium]|nr:hypothetical protein [bacterium]
MVGIFVLMIGIFCCGPRARARAAQMPISFATLGSLPALNGQKYVKVNSNNKFVSVAAADFGCHDPNLAAGQSHDFPYTGGEQSWDLYPHCTYQLEVWGAQGGYERVQYPQFRGGYGGYATGIVSFLQNQTISIVVGSQGQDGCTYNTCAGGYNGGGWGAYYSPGPGNWASGGGGATHMATDKRGVLANYNNNRSEVILVAGGGGAGYWWEDWSTHTMLESNSAIGGNAGGYIGSTGYSSGTRANATGGTQTAGGQRGFRGGNGSFGQGGQGRTGCDQGGDENGCSSSGGGGGWFGGGAAAHNATAGGSGYINSSYLTSNIALTKHMTCYNCATSTAASTYTISNTCASATATSDCSKTGHGYARITRVQTLQSFTPSMCAAAATPALDGYTDLGTMVDERDGKSYAVRKYSDGRCWMAENLKFGSNCTATNFPNTNPSSVTGYVGTYGGHAYRGRCTSPGSAYDGYLYDWEATMNNNTALYNSTYVAHNSANAFSNGTTLAKHDVCPLGWHVATVIDLQTLANQVQGSNVANGCAISTCSTAANFFWTNTSNAWNATGRSTKAGDIYASSKRYQGSGLIIHSSTVSGGGEYTLQVNANSSNVISPAEARNRFHGFSVRCVADY